ncbi:MAG: hypothetical protein RL011_2033, partial [Pseudomonadota bacterium]
LANRGRLAGAADISAERIEVVVVIAVISPAVAETFVVAAAVAGWLRKD